MPQKTNRITRGTPTQQFSKIDSWIDDETWDALQLYMEQNNRKRADAIRILLKKCLDLEGLMKGGKV